MNNKYYQGIKNDQINNNINVQNPSSPLNLNNQSFSTDFLINPLKDDEININNIKKNSLLYIQRDDYNNINGEKEILINNKLLTKSALKDSKESNIDKHIININTNNIDLSNNNNEKFVELLENNKLINTLNSIKTSTSININYEEIKLLPNLFLEMQQALKKSNQNVLELKETIKEKIISEKKLKQKLKQYENENKNLNEKLSLYKIKENEIINENYNLRKKDSYNIDLKNKFDQILLDNENLKKINNELLLKIDKLEFKKKINKNNYGILQSELNNLKAKNEKEIFSYMNNIKDMKTELKNQLTEKMNLINEINNLENIISKIKEENLNLKENLFQTEKMKEKLEQLLNKYKKNDQENEELNIGINNKKDINKDIFGTINDKYEKEEFNLKSEMNIWKKNFFNITKFKLYNLDPKYIKNIEKLLNIEEKYIINAPSEIIQRSEKVFNYCKNLIEEVNYNTINLKDLKEELTKEQENNIKLIELLEKEKYLRRKIHNRYMYLRGNMRVMVRVRPFLSNEIKNKTSQMETIIIKNDSIIINENNKQPKIFEFDYIFNEQSLQEEVYEEVTLLIQSIVQGNNICIISYGQTCTGKTYTIQGESKNEGIISRTAKELFEIIENLMYKNNRKNESNNPYFIKARLNMTIIEIYNEQIFNLLEESTPNLSIYEDSNGNLIIPDLSPININSFEEANKLFILSSKFRHTSTTEFNERSSRSHCIFSFHIKLTNNENNTIRSTIHIIDLAGSERITKGENNNAKLKKEAININLSLHSLSNVLNSIANKSNHIPYRDSKLTHFLKESLNENFNILLLLHISPNINDLSETISTLKFGERIIKFCHHKTGKEKNKLINTNKNLLNEENK